MSNPTPSRRDGEATRQRLLRAALDLYTTIGFRATTTPAIAARAGVAEGTIYRHFSGKEQLLNEAYRGAQHWATGLVRELDDADRGLGAGERLQRIARRFFEAAAREFRGALQQVVAGGKSDGVVRAGPAELWAAVWLSVVAFGAERVSAKEWAPDHPQLALVVEA